MAAAVSCRADGLLSAAVLGLGLEQAEAEAVPWRKRCRLPHPPASFVQWPVWGECRLRLFLQLGRGTVAGGLGNAEGMTSASG